MLKRFLYAVPILCVSFMALFVLPEFLVQAPEWYYRLPSVLPPSSWVPVMRILGVILGVIGMAVIVVPILFSAPAADRKKAITQYPKLGPSATEDGIVLLVNWHDSGWRRVVGPPELMQTLGKGTGVIYVTASSNQANVRDWSGGRVMPDRFGINGISHARFEYAEE